MDRDLPEQSGGHATKHLSESKVSPGDMKVEFSDELRSAFAKLYEAGKGAIHDGENVLSLKEFATPSNTTNVKQLLLELPQIALHIGESGNKDARKALYDVLYELGGEKAISLERRGSKLSV